MMGTTFSAASDVLSVKEYSHPSKADWITAHAKATGCEFPAIVFIVSVDTGAFLGACAAK